MDKFSLEGRYYTIKDARLAPKPVQRPWPTLYAGGESPAAKDLIARECDAYLMHGDPPDALATKIKDMRCAPRESTPASGAPVRRRGVRDPAKQRRRGEEGARPHHRRSRKRARLRQLPGLHQGLAARDHGVARGLQRFERGLRTGLVGTPDQVANRVRELERIGIDLLLLQSSPSAKRCTVLVGRVPARPQAHADVVIKGDRPGRRPAAHDSRGARLGDPLTLCCTLCDLEKPATNDFFIPRADRPGQFYPYCRTCWAVKRNTNASGGH